MGIEVFLLVVVGVVLGVFIGRAAPTRKKSYKFNKAFAVVEDTKSNHVFVRRVTVDGGNETVEFRVPGLTAADVPRLVHARVVKRFFICDTPSRKEWTGAAETYRDICAIALHYRWVRQNGKGYAWLEPFHNKERRERWIETAL